MQCTIRLLVFCIFCPFIVCLVFPISDEETAVLYLQYFGYLENSDNIPDPIAISNALKDFQGFFRLNQTGELDHDTITVMNTPRCGNRDRNTRSVPTRRKRYVLQGGKWKVTRLMYRISKYPSKLRNRRKVDEEIARAFKVWSDVSKLTFEERKRGRVNIDIRFETRGHGDPFSFDGPGNALAHAFGPQFGGDVHFDDEEDWTVDERSGTNLFQIAAHEFGHSLGLSHSHEKNALMYPYDSGYQPAFNLHADDIRGIQELYGSKATEAPPTDNPPLDISDVPNLCQDASIDTMTKTEDRSTYVFKGEFYWKILSNGIAAGYPRIISHDWIGLKGNLDASVTFPNGKTYFFKGGRYWRFKNKEMDNGYPKLISRGFEGIPDMLDAAFVWNKNNKIYFFKGDKYWRYDRNSDPQVDSKYPMPISRWNGLPNDIDAAFRGENNKTYFFKADKYYRFDDASFQVDLESPSFPRLTSVWWLKC